MGREINSNASTYHSVKEASHYLDTAFPIFFFLLAISFYLRTYDSAQVKITEVQMFGIILVALWLYKIFESGQWPFSKNQTLLLLPLILMFVSGVFSMLFVTPLRWGSFDFFIRRVVYVGVALIAVTEITSLQDFRKITKWLVIAIAVSTIYGLIQWIDFYFFPAGPPTAGIDKFVWRRAFGARIFSTFGNPNFYSNFLVIMVPVMAALYLKSRQFYLIPLIILTLINIKWTGSKGPAAGLMAGTTVFTILFYRFFTTSKKVRMAIISSALGILLLLGSYIGYRVFGGGGEITSFSFRMYTWLATWEMVNARPILGNGIGTFWVIYPAYRRPAIFHIEAKHNTETDHAENEHLEVWFDEGIIGMGFWIWMILMLSYGIYRTLKVLISQPSRAGPKNEQKIPEEAYYMLGFFSGFLGMLIHNNTDVSMRFVSSGTPFWLLAGLTTALVMYSPLPEKQAAIPLMKETTAEGNENHLHLWILKILKSIVACVVIIVAIRILREFDWCQMRDGMNNPNEQPHFFITWAFFLLCWGTVSWWFLRLTFLAAKLKSLLVLFIASILQVPFWGFFVGDVNHNRAIFFSKQGIWTRTPEFDSRLAQFPKEYQMMYSGEGGGIEEDSSLGKVMKFLFPDIFWRKNGIGGALEHYQQVHKLSPFMIMSHYFRGNVHNDWGSDFARRCQDAFSRGDLTQAEIFRKKTEEHWEAALGAYADTRRLGPNYVQMHHQRGTVYQKWGDFYMHTLAPVADQLKQPARAEEYRKKAKEYWNLALEAYQLYYKIDPVFDQNYYRQAQIYTQLGELDKAEQVYIDHIEAKECKKPYHQIFGGFRGKRPDANKPWDMYDLGSALHTHDTAHYPKNEAWLYLGDFYSFVKNSPARAEAAYLKATQIRPDSIDFKKRLANFYARTGKNQEAIKIWQEIFRINPQDPDLQRIIQIQPQKKT